MSPIKCFLMLQPTPMHTCYKSKPDTVYSCQGPCHITIQTTACHSGKPEILPEMCETVHRYAQAMLLLDTKEWACRYYFLPLIQFSMLLSSQCPLTLIDKCNKTLVTNILTIQQHCNASH